MTQFSGWWDTEDTVPVGHQVAEYTEAHLKIAVDVISACYGQNGIAPNFDLGTLAGTANPGGATDRTVRIGPGAALVDGKWFRSTVAEDLVLDEVVGGGNTRIDRIVVQTDWSGKQTELTVIKGVEGGTPAVPSIVQTTGTRWDNLGWQALIDTSGLVVLTDERVWAKVSMSEMDDMAMGVIGRQTNTTGALSRIYTTNNDRVLMRKANELVFAQVDSDQIVAGAIDLAHMSANSVDSDQYVDGSIDLAHMNANSVDSDQYVDGSIDTVHIGDSQVTAIKIANRTRNFLVHPIATINPEYYIAAILNDSVITEVVGFFTVPTDFVSGMTVKPVLSLGLDNAGTIRRTFVAEYGADGQSVSAHTNTTGAGEVALAGGEYVIQVLPSLSLASAAADDFIRLKFARDGNHANDTYLGACYVIGFLVEYTADS